MPVACLQFCFRNISKMELIGLKLNLKTIKIALIFLKRYRAPLPHFDLFCVIFTLFLLQLEYGGKGNRENLICFFSGPYVVLIYAILFLTAVKLNILGYDFVEIFCRSFV